MCRAAALVAVAACAWGAEVCVEVEHANQVVPMMEIVRNKDASGGLCVAVGEGAGRAKSPGPGATSSAWLWINVPEAGTYRAWVRAIWIGGCSNSVNLSVDGGLAEMLTDREYDIWHWVRGPYLQLDAGAHLIELSNREDGILLDQIWLTTERTPPGLTARTVTQTPAAPEEGGVADLQATLSGVGNIVDHPAPLFGEDIEKSPVIYSAFVMPGSETAEVTLWLRNNTTEPLAGKLAIESAEGAAVSVEDVNWKVGANGLTGVALRLAMPLKERRLAVPVTLRLKPEGMDAPNPVRLIVHALPAWRKRGPFNGARPGEVHARVKETFAPTAEPFDPAKSFDQYGRFDLNAAFGAQEYVTGFAEMRLRSDAARTVDCYLAHDDHMVVWVNGKAVYSADYIGPASDSRSRVPLPLREGENDILLGVGEEQRCWHFSFIVTPPPDAGVFLPPPPPKEGQ